MDSHASWVLLLVLLWARAPAGSSSHRNQPAPLRRSQPTPREDTYRSLVTVHVIGCLL